MVLKSFIQNDIKYYKYQYSTFTQPSLSGNGSMGGTSWAVAGKGSGGTPDANNPYQAVYPQTGTYNIYNKGGQPSLTVTMYTPNPTVITSATFTALWGNYSDSYVNIRFRASNDNNTWTTLYPQASLHEGTQTISFNNSNTYKYYELYVLTTGGGYHDGIRLSGIKLTGQNKVSIAGTADDYDYTTTTSTYKVFKCTQSNTNCLTYIPNDINLTLSNGTLTLKAGSKVYVPNGKDSNGNNVFEEVIISADRVFNYGYNDSRLLFTNVAGDYFYGFPVSACYSGATAPTGNQWMYWYDTTNNIIKNTSDSGATWVQGYSLPLCKITMNSNNVTSIDQIFNGFGYMGNIIYCLPGVKGLIPDGKNSDGSNNCIETTISTLKTTTCPTWTRPNQPMFLADNQLQVTGTADGRYYAYKDTGTQNSLTYVTYFDTNENKMYHSDATAGSYSQVQYFFFGYVTLTSGVISNMRIQSVKSETIPHYKTFSV